MKDMAGTLEKKKRRVHRTHSAKEKSQAVLSLWSGRRSASEVMKQMEVPWGVLNGWEKRAINGMLRALDPTWEQVQEQALKLPKRLEKLMEKTLRVKESAVAD